MACSQSGLMAQNMDVVTSVLRADAADEAVVVQLVLRRLVSKHFRSAVAIVLADAGWRGPFAAKAKAFQADVALFAGEINVHRAGACVNPTGPRMHCFLAQMLAFATDKPALYDALDHAELLLQVCERAGMLAHAVRSTVCVPQLVRHVLLVAQSDPGDLCLQAKACAVMQ